MQNWKSHQAQVCAHVEHVTARPAQLLQHADVVGFEDALRAYGSERARSPWEIDPDTKIWKGAGEPVKPVFGPLTKSHTGMLSFALTTLFCDENLSSTKPRYWGA